MKDGIKPIVPVSREGLDEIAQALLNGNDKAQPKQKTSRRPTPSSEKSEKYLILEGQPHGTYSYPDLLVATQTTYKDIDWNDTHEKLEKNGELMLTPRQFADFLAMLKSGNAYYASGKQADSRVLDRMYDEITKVKDPWRAEWLDAKFDKKSKGILGLQSTFEITYHKIKSDGTIEEVTEPLEDCLMSDKKPGIDLADWLKNANNQGLPKKDVKNGKLWYYAPTNGAVAGFGADSDGANLDCNGDPSDTGDALGVRPAKFKK